MIDDKYKGIQSNFESYPADDVEVDYDAPRKAMENFQAGDICVIFIPDNFHCEVALQAMERGMHVMVAKPITQTLDDHKKLLKKAEEKNVLLCCEYHKRFDPAFSEARMKMKDCGEMGYYVSFMSQPKVQLETFRK